MNASSASMDDRRGERQSSTPSSQAAASASAQQRTADRSQSRSPRRFARLRQTRVASLSPTPTLVGGGGGNGSTSWTSAAAQSSALRNRRDRSPAVHRAEQGTARPATAADLTHPSIPSSARRARSRRRPSSNDPDADAQTDANGKSPQEQEHGHRQAASVDNDRDLEKGKQAPARSSVGQSLDAVHSHPASRVLRHFLGFRAPASALSEKHRLIKPFPSILPIVHRIPPAVESLLWTLVGSFVGLSVAQLIFARPTHFTSSTDVGPHAWQAPIIIGSFGASSVLLYAAPASPLGQPRCFVGGQLISAIVGCAVTKLFQLAGSPAYNLDRTDTSASLVWICGALAAACSLCLMMATGTLHPPGGATALLCATNAQVAKLGWKVIPIVLLTSAVMLFWTLIWMNLGRKRYPESFNLAAPATFNEGNLSEYFVQLCKRRLFSKPAPQGGPDAAKGASEAQPPSKSTSADEWQDETDWRLKHTGPDAVDEADEEGIEEETPVERPSRWATATDRGSTIERIAQR